MASITGGYVALAIGLKKRITSSTLPAQTLRPPIAADSVGVVQGQPTQDLDYIEDSQADVEVNAVNNTDDHYVEIQGTAENHPFTPHALQSMLSLAEKGIQELIARQVKILQDF